MTSVTDNQEINNPEKIPVVETYQLSKNYRTGFFMNQKIASLKNCTLTVYKGETFGLLGPNGAGKTTLLKTLMGIIKPSGGKALLMGKPLGDRLVKKSIGYLPENAYFYDYLTGWEFLDFVGGLFEIPTKIRRKRINEILELVGLSQVDAKKKQMRKYSKGMLQRIGVAQALINDPEVVFLDEPMSGLDPMGRYQIREIILSLQEQGKTIFFNSHVLAEVEKICDRIAILAKGELICIGAIKELIAPVNVYNVRGKGGNIDILEQWINNITFEDEYWFGQLKGDPQDFIGTVVLMGGTLISMNLAQQSLEEFFIHQIQKQEINASN
jgi:ABC-2 type transport system ATP-binding protein